MGFSFSFSDFQDMVLNCSLIASRYWIDFNKWEVFVNDDHTRSFLSLEVIRGGLAEVGVLNFLSFFTAMIIASHIEHAYAV